MRTKLNLGCGRDIRPGWINVDIEALEGVSIVGDISDPATFASIPFDSLEIIEMSHILEHIANPLPMLEALWVRAKHDCQLHIAVPHGSNDMAFADPQHIRQYFPSSFQFFAQPSYKRADYNYRGDWETKIIKLFVDPRIPDEVPDEQLSHMVHTARNVVWEMRAMLTAVKPRRLVSATWQFNPKIQISKVST